MRKTFLAGALAALLLGVPTLAQAQDGEPLAPPDQSAIDQQPQQQQTPETAQPGTGGAGDQQQPQTDQPGAQAPTDQQPGVGGAGAPAGAQAPAGCQCANCPMGKGQAQGQGMQMGGMMMQGPMHFGPRLGEISKITVENTREGAVIRFNAVDAKDLAEVQSLAKAIGSQWEAMGLQAKQKQQQKPPAQP